MAQTVKLKNLKRQVQVFNLEHSFFVNQQGENGVGEPESLTLLSLETKEVPVQVLECAEIKAALRPAKGLPSLRVLAK